MMSDQQPLDPSDLQPADGPDPAAAGELRCGECDAYHPVNIGHGECRPGPPQAFMVVTDRGPAFVSAWPSVPADGWCSQFTPKGKWPPSLRGDEGGAEH